MLSARLPSIPPELRSFSNLSGNVKLNFSRGINSKGDDVKEKFTDERLSANDFNLIPFQLKFNLS